MTIPKSYEVFQESLSAEGPSPLWPESLQALWWDAKGNWEKSHLIAQDIANATGNWIHAYLHRKEGDQWNAGYWYDRAGRPFSNLSHDEELREIVCSVLQKD